MGISERKEREKQELKDLILLKAKEIMSRDGQEGLSIRKIASEIEYSPATIYLYFQDKDEILYQMMNKGFSLLAREMEPVLLEQDPIKRLYDLGKVYIDFGIANWDWYDLMFNSSSPMNHLERCQAEWGPGISLFEYLVTSCQQALDSQSRTKPDGRSLALQLWATVHGLVNLASTQRLCVVDKIVHDPIAQDELIADALKTTIYTIFQYTD